MQCEQSLHEIPSIGESQWTGNAADQFRLRMQAMRSVLSDTQNDMERLLRDVESVMV